PADRPGPARHPGARAHVAARPPADFRRVHRLLPGSTGCRPRPHRQARGYGQHASAARRPTAGLLGHTGDPARDRPAWTGWTGWTAGAGLGPAGRPARLPAA